MVFLLLRISYTLVQLILLPLICDNKTPKISTKLTKEIKMPNKKYKTNKPRECPKCGSDKTRFLEPRDGLLVFDCNICGCRFEVEDEE